MCFFCLSSCSCYLLFLRYGRNVGSLNHWGGIRLGGCIERRREREVRMDGEEGKIWNEKKDSPTIKNRTIFSRIHIAERYYKVSPGKNLLLGEFFSHTFLHPRSPSCYTHVCSPFLLLFLFLPLLFVLPFLLLVCPKVRTAMKERRGGWRDRPRRRRRLRSRHEAITVTN